MSSNSCQHIDLAIKLCKLSGNSVKEVSKGWTNAKQVFHLSNPLTDELKQKIEAEVSTLEYWKETQDTHYEPMEGFFCNECKEGMAFPSER